MDENQTPTKTKLIPAIIGIFILVVIGAVAYTNIFRAQTQTPQAPTPAVTEATITTPSTGEVMINGEKVKEFTVIASDFRFSLNNLTVNQGDTVRITLKNTEGGHDLVINEYNVRTKVIGKDKEDTIEFIASKAGSFEFYCSVNNHRQMGMVGTLTVL